MLGGNSTLKLPSGFCMISNKTFAVPPVVRIMGNVLGSLSVKTIGWALYVSPGVPLQVPVSGKVNCEVMGGERSPCSSAIIRRVSGTHSATESIVTCTPSVSCEPETDALMTDNVSCSCVHVTGDAPDAASDESDDDAVELADDDASASVDDVVELAAPPAGTAAPIVLVAKIPASDPRLELTTYVPPPL